MNNVGDARQSAVALWVQTPASLWAALSVALGVGHTFIFSCSSLLCAAQTHLLADLCQPCACLDTAAAGEAHSPRLGACRKRNTSLPSHWGCQQPTQSLDRGQLNNHVGSVFHLFSVSMQQPEALRRPKLLPHLGNRTKLDNPRLCEPQPGP